MNASPDPSAPSPVSAARPRGPGGTLLVFLLAGLIAGGTSLAVVAVFGKFHRVPAELRDISPLDEAGQARLVAAEAEMATKNLFLTLGVLGAAVGGVMGLAGGLRDRSFGRGAVGLVAGLVLGAGLGVASAYLGPEQVGPRIDAAIPRDAPYETRQNWTMFRALAVHATFWGLIGLAAALAATLPTRRIGLTIKSSVGALVAAALAMMVYHALLGNLFQLSRFQLLLPHEMGPIVAWTLPTTLLIGIALGRLSMPNQRPELVG